MRRYNIILLLDHAGENVLMCRRAKEPYAGLYNLVGGKLECGEDALHSAYRELREESGVTAADVSLRFLMTFVYPDAELHVFAGRLRHPVRLRTEVNPLIWIPVVEDFFDFSRFAGEGNIGHMLAAAQRNYPELLAVHEPAVTLSALSASDLPVIAFHRSCQEEDLEPMLKESIAKAHEGRYYEQFVIRMDGCAVGVCSLYAHEDGTASDGIEVFPAFRGCGFASKALTELAALAEQSGYQRLCAQVRSDNAASLALHRKNGFCITQRRINRKGNEVYELQKELIPCRRHEMSLRPKPFEAIACGQKRYELRLHDEKRRQICVGDELLFSCTADDRQVLTRVTGLHPFRSFGELYAALPLTECGYTPENVHRASPLDMEAYYSPEKQAQFGVLAIELEQMRYPLDLLTGAYSVRELTVDDVPEMLRIAQGNPLYYEYMKIRPTSENLAETLTALPPRRTMADKHFFGWFQGTRLIAMMDLIAHHPQPDMAFIGWFMVDASQQGRGLGRQLVAKTLEMLMAQGMREVRLGRIEGNPQSERFWHACCFEENGLSYDTPDYRVVVMARELV